MESYTWATLSATCEWRICTQVTGVLLITLSHCTRLQITSWKQLPTCSIGPEVMMRFSIISIRVRYRFRRDASHMASLTYLWTVTGTRFNGHIYIKIIERHDGRWEGDMWRSSFCLRTDWPTSTEVIARAYRARACNIIYFVWLVSFGYKGTQPFRVDEKNHKIFSFETATITDQRKIFLRCFVTHQLNPDGP